MALNIATGVSILGVWIFPIRVALPLLAAAMPALPLISLGLLVRSDGLYQLDRNRNDTRPSLAIPFGFPAAVIFFLSFGFRLLRYGLAIAVAICFAIVIAMIAVRYDAGARQGLDILLFLLPGIMYSYGAIANANALLDRSEPQTFRVLVLSKHVSDGKSTSWHLRIDQWGQQQTPDEISVSSSLYNAVEPGQSVCFILRPGALKIPWYVVSVCR